MAAVFDTLEHAEGVLYGTCDGILVMLMHAKPSAQGMRLAKPALRAMQRRCPDGFPVLTWVLPEAGFTMEPEARHAAVAVTKEFVASITAMATLIEGAGFQAAAVRAIVSGLDALSGATAPKKVFAALAPSISWCCGLRPATFRDPAHPSVAELVVTLARVRADVRSLRGTD